MPREVRIYLEDILEAIRRIEGYTAGMDGGALSTDPLVLDAVLHNLQIVGEATKRVPDHLRRMQPGTEWRNIAGMRDVIVHAYFNVDPQIVWDVVTNKLPPLRLAVESILREIDA